MTFKKMTAKKKMTIKKKMTTKKMTMYIHH